MQVGVLMAWFAAITQVLVPPTARERPGVQPVVTLTADGGTRADVAAGTTVSFSAVAEVPPDTGDIVAAQWDFLGLGTYPVTATRATYTYSSPGTYFPVVRVTSQWQGDPNTPRTRASGRHLGAPKQLA